eukprot:5992262-Amphidinium_carterae.1
MPFSLACMSRFSRTRLRDITLSLESAVPGSNCLRGDAQSKQTWKERQLKWTHLKPRTHLPEVEQVKNERFFA